MAQARAERYTKAVTPLLCFLLLAGPAPAAPLDSELAPIVDALYDLQFDSAAAAVERLTAAHPGHPAPAFYRSLVDYQRWAFDPEGDKAAPKAFEDGLAETERLAEEWISTSPVDGYYYIGAARGFASRVLADRGRFIRAASPGVRSVKYFRKALALDPALTDANLGLGMYDYLRAQMPAAAKPFAFLFTFDTGSRERGLKELSLVAEAGALAKAEAQNVLSAIYASDEEREWGKASELLRDLAARYPHNPMFRLRLGYAELRLGHWESVIAADDPDGTWLAGLDAKLRGPARSVALYRSAEAALLGGQFDRAAPWLDQLAAMSLDQSLDDWVALRRANLYDAKGAHDDAAAIYRRIEDSVALKLANLFLVTPFPDGPRDVKPWTGFEAPR